MKNNKDSRKVTKVVYLVECSQTEPEIYLHATYSFDDESTERRTQVFNLQVIPGDVALQIVSQIINGTLYAKK